MKRIGRQVRHVAGMVLVAVMLTACSESMGDLEKYIESVKARPALGSVTLVAATILSMASC